MPGCAHLRNSFLEVHHSVAGLRNYFLVTINETRRKLRLLFQVRFPLNLPGTKEYSLQNLPLALWLSGRINLCKLAP